jgi:phage FluMu protein Com
LGDYPDGVPSAFEGNPIVTFVKATGQSWKLNLWFAVCASTFGVALLHQAVADAIGLQPAFLVLYSAILLFFLAGIVAATFLKCPRCQYSFFWHSFVHVGALEVIEWLLTFKQCPNCKYLPEGSAEEWPKIGGT